MQPPSGFEHGPLDWESSALTTRPLLHNRDIPHGRAVRIKRVCSDEEDQQQKLNDLESWLIDRSYRAEIFRPEID